MILVYFITRLFFSNVIFLKLEIIIKKEVVRAREKPLYLMLMDIKWS